ncbi:MAG: OmpA family protein, partial [Alphaproteobacteria bacterium]
TMSARVETPALEPAPAKTAAKLELPAADAMITPELETPDPMPDTVLAIAPEIAPEDTVLAIAPEIAPEEMSPDERAAAKESNKNSVSSTSFADEAALMDDDGDAAAMDAKPTSTQPKAEPEPQPETEMATLAPAVAPTTPGETMQIEFGAGESALPQSAQAPLATLAAALGQDETLRLQLRAYAGGDADSASHARRLSLSRALAVRSELIEQGVRSTRIDVRALGNKSENGSSDRVDVILVQR